MSLRQYTDYAFGWGRFQPDRGYEFSGTALVTRTKVLLVDPIAATPDEIDQIAALRAPARRFEVVLLNADHERAADAFAKDFDAPVWAPRADLDAIKFRGAQPYDDGHDFGDGWFARGVPNHKTPGETVLHNATLRMLVVGDAVISDPVTGLRLVPPAKLKDRRAALAALRDLAGLDFDALLAADGFQLPSGGREALKRFLEKEGA